MRKYLVSLVITSSLILSGCGGEDNNPSGDGGTVLEFSLAEARVTAGEDAYIILDAYADSKSFAMAQKSEPVSLKDSSSCSNKLKFFPEDFSILENAPSRVVTIHTPTTPCTHKIAVSLKGKLVAETDLTTLGAIESSLIATNTSQSVLSVNVMKSVTSQYTFQYFNSTVPTTNTISCDVTGEQAKFKINTHPAVLQPSVDFESASYDPIENKNNSTGTLYITLTASGMTRTLGPNGTISMNWKATHVDGGRFTVSNCHYVSTS